MQNNKPKFIRTSTVPESLNLLLKNQLRFLNAYFRIIVVSSAGTQLNEIADREGVETVALETERDIAPSKDLISLINWIKFLRKERPAIVHSHSPKANLISMLAAKFCRIPVRIITVTGLRFETLTGLKKWVVILLEKLACWSATQIIAEGKGVKNTMLKHNITSKEIYIIGNGNINGIDTEYWNSNKVPDASIQAMKAQFAIEQTFNFIYVGRLVVDKGIHELISAFEKLSAEFPNARLIIVGYYEKGINQLSDTIIQKINSHAQIIFAGFQSDIRPWLLISNVLILPSYREGFPNVVLQAGAMGIPVIVTRVNGADEIIDGKNGVIIGIKNIPELVETMHLFISGKYDYKSMGIHAEKVVQEKFNQVFLYQELMKFYRAVIPARIWPH